MDNLTVRRTFGVGGQQVGCGGGQDARKLKKLQNKTNICSGMTHIDHESVLLHAILNDDSSLRVIIFSIFPRQLFFYFILCDDACSISSLAFWVEPICGSVQW